MIKSSAMRPIWQGVGTSCELILADKVNIVKAGAKELFKDCH